MTDHVHKRPRSQQTMFITDRVHNRPDRPVHNRRDRPVRNRPRL